MSIPKLISVSKFDFEFPTMYYKNFLREKWIKIIFQWEVDLQRNNCSDNDFCWFVFQWEICRSFHAGWSGLAIACLDRVFSSACRHQSNWTRQQLSRNLNSKSKRKLVEWKTTINFKNIENCLSCLKTLLKCLTTVLVVQ